MNERPTPKTDALTLAYAGADPARARDAVTDSHRNLERQCDEALKRLESSKRARKSLSDACDFLRAKLRTTESLARELRDALQLATDECLWRSDSETPLSSDDSQRIYDTAVAALKKANKLLP